MSENENEIEAELAAETETSVSETPQQETTPADKLKEETGGFRSLGLTDAIVASVEKSGYDTPTPIQAKTIPLILKGGDVIGQAQTGTGKTAAFALPILEQIDLFDKRTQILVLVPTRELANQVCDAFKKYANGMRGLQVTAIFGGQDYQVQFRQLNRGAHIVVGTPGRVMDHMRRGSLQLSGLKCLVLDEADEMLRMGFADDVEWVLTQAPKQRQMVLFSATMPPGIRKIAQQHLIDPAEVTIKQRTATADTVNQRYIITPSHNKASALIRILEAEATDGVLVFVKTRSSTEPLAEQLSTAGHRTAALHGDISQKQRERTMQRLKSGQIDLVVATDVAARGLDVQRISHVINYDLPFDSEAYVHRIGRTGRAGRSGQAILFVQPRERRALKRLEQATRQTIVPMDLPSNREVNKSRVKTFHEQMTEALSHKELESFRSVVEQYQRENDVPPELIAAALGVMANRGESLFVTEKPKQTRFTEKERRTPKRRFDSGNAEAGMTTYRIEVGRKHQVQPRNIVGAITNEIGIGNEAIGKIKIFDNFSTVDLPSDMASEALFTLKDVYVSGRKLQISADSGGRPRHDRSRSRYEKQPPRKPKFKAKRGKPSFRQR